VYVWEREWCGFIGMYTVWDQNMEMVQLEHTMRILQIVLNEAIYTWSWEWAPGLKSNFSHLVCFWNVMVTKKGENMNMKL
jgi:hypothetical protein